MRRAPQKTLLAVLTVIALPGAAEDNVEVIEIIDSDSGDAGALDEPAFVTRVRVDTRESASVGDVLARSVGVRVKSVGGLGGFSALSIRGGAAGHTQVLIDGVPVSRLGFATADLGRYELQSFASMDVYRGGAPLAFGSAAIGGAVNLSTLADGRPELRVGLGGGSFGARRAYGLWRDVVGSTLMHVAGSYTGARGDYEFFNDNGTGLNASDDGTSTRSNNDFDRGEFVFRMQRPVHQGRAQAGVRVSGKSQGIPGTANQHIEEARLITGAVLADGAVERAVGTVDARLAVFGLVEATAYRDELGEVGLGMQDRRYTTVSVGPTATVAGAFGEHHTLTASVDGRYDVFRETDLLAGMASTSGARVGGGISLADEIQVMDGAIVARAAARVDWMRTRPAAETNSPTGAVSGAVHSDVFVSPRLAARWRIGNHAIKANGGYYFRPPTLVEMFGDRGFVVGNPALVPETGVSADVGWTAVRTGRVGPFDQLYGEVTAFVSTPRDTIVFVANAGQYTQALNLSSARIVGGEMSGAVRIAELVSIAANYTLVSSEQGEDAGSFEGKALPSRPMHDLYIRTSAGGRIHGRGVGGFIDLSIASHSYLDAGNFVAVPRRSLVGLGAELDLFGDLSIALQVRNLFDQRVQQVALQPPPNPSITHSPRAVADFFGYPLPGRAVYATLEWRPRRDSNNKEIQ